ncbi:MAG: NADH-quinone oxidoreductase subunit NuoK [bacterium]
MDIGIIDFDYIYDILYELLIITPKHYLFVGGIVFAIGLMGTMIRRNAIAILLGIELMLNSVNIILITGGRAFGTETYSAGAFVVFVITVAACEAIVGLALILAAYRHLKDINIDKMNILKW